MKNFLSRTLTGIVYVAVIVAGICINSVTFTALGCLLAGLGVAEFVRITASRSLAMTLADVAGGLLTVTGCYSVAFAAREGRVVTTLCLWGALWLVWFIARLVAQLYSHNPSPLRVLATSLAAQVYVALPLALMGCIYVSAKGHALLLAVFILIWINDTGAYLVGSRIGRHRLFERLSPKKSWEGFFGGLVLAVAAGTAMQYAFPAYYGVRAAWFMPVLALTVSVVGTWGDLVESMIKRTLQVKDSGHLLPGHGGILDRIDSLLLAIPAVVALLAFSAI